MNGSPISVIQQLGRVTYSLEISVWDGQDEQLVYPIGVPTSEFYDFTTLHIRGKEMGLK